jgi:DNA repair exonuclease SbcCD ATPase subunit
MASNTINIAMGHLVDCCRLEIVDLQNHIQELTQVLEDEERYGDDEERRNNLRTAISALRNDIETRENALTAISNISFNNIDIVALEIGA